MSSVQSVSRAFDILRVIAHHQGTGVRLKDLTVLTGLAQPTVHRLLVELQAQGVVQQRLYSRRYFLGEMVAELGLTASVDHDFVTLCKPSVARIAAETGDTAFVSKRSGLDLLCLERRSGAHLFKAFMLDVGVRRPLGVGASGLALLMYLPESELIAILQRNAGFLRQRGSDIDKVRQLLGQAQQQGYVVRDAQEMDIRSVAVPILNQKGHPGACLSISATRNRLQDGRLTQVITLLEREAKRLQEVLVAQEHEPERLL